MQNSIQGSIQDRQDKSALKKLSEILSSFQENTDTLEIQLESSLKHIQSYIKVIKSHVPELQEVLKTENHSYKNIENINLQDSVQRLLKILEKIDDKDIMILEELCQIAKRWQGAKQRLSEAQQQKAL